MLGPATPPTVLCWGSVEGTAMPELFEVAAVAGFAGVTVTPAMYFAAVERGMSGAGLRARLDDHGIRVSVVDPLLAALPGCPSPDSVAPRFRSTFEHDEDDCYRVAHDLGATTINVAHYMGAPTPISELTDAIGGVCERARREGLAITVEFMPEGSIPDLAVAARIVHDTGAPNVGVMLDTWHFFRTGGRPDDVRALPAGTVAGMQLSDAAAALRGAGTRARADDRLMPGAGAIPLVEILTIVLGDRPDLDAGIEVFGATAPPLETALRCATSLRAVLAQAGTHRDALPGS